MHPFFVIKKNYATLKQQMLPPVKQYTLFWQSFSRKIQVNRLSA